LSDAVSENMANFLRCFGDVQYDEETIMVAPKEEEKQQGKCIYFKLISKKIFLLKKGHLLRRFKNQFQKF